MGYATAADLFRLFLNSQPFGGPTGPAATLGGNFGVLRSFLIGTIHKAVVVGLMFETGIILGSGINATIEEVFDPFGDQDCY